jgi:hypothetical protein
MYYFQRFRTFCLPSEHEVTRHTATGYNKALIEILTLGSLFNRKRNIFQITQIVREILAHVASLGLDF